MPVGSVECTATTRAGRLAKARQFWLAADTLAAVIDDQEIADAYVTLCVHAGIAAADVVCCAKLGKHRQGENHREAVAWLAKVDRDASQHLRSLLVLKTRSGYSPMLTSTTDQKRAGRAAKALLQVAETV